MKNRKLPVSEEKYTQPISERLMKAGRGKLIIEVDIPDNTALFFTDYQEIEFKGTIGDKVAMFLNGRNNQKISFNQQPPKAFLDAVSEQILVSEISIQGVNYIPRKGFKSKPTDIVVQVNSGNVVTGQVVYPEPIFYVYDGWNFDSDDESKYSHNDEKCDDSSDQEVLDSIDNLTKLCLTEVQEAKKAESIAAKKNALLPVDINSLVAQCLAEAEKAEKEERIAAEKRALLAAQKAELVKSFELEMTKSNFDFRLFANNNKIDSQSTAINGNCTAGLYSIKK